MAIGYKVKRGLQFVFDKDYRFWYLSLHGRYHEMGDEEYLRKKYRAYMKRDLNLDDPKTFTEKMQWLKLYYRRPEFTTMVDKYAVKAYAANIIGKEHIIPLLGVWDTFDAIDFDVLPDQFVLKCTHDSGGYAVCTNQATFDKVRARKKIEASLANNYYWTGREWPYKDVPPRIIAEQYMPSLGKPETIEYKVTCMDGRAECITVCKGVPHAGWNERTNDFYDRDFNLFPFVTEYYKNSHIAFEKPAEWEEMLEICEKMSAGIPVVRVDCYIIDGTVYFGEMTFYSWAGFIHFNPEEYDRIAGDMITLPVPYV